MTIAARATALAVLPVLEEGVRSRTVLTYGYFARRIGLDPRRHAIQIGPAMHAIGAACIFACLPVLPLAWVRRADDASRGIFATDISESIHVLPHRDLMSVAARVHGCRLDDFTRLAHGLRCVIPADWSPHAMWHVAIYQKPQGSPMTYFERALESYRLLLDRVRAEQPTRSTSAQRSLTT